ncbi:MAG TPA: phenylalanine--tRNA ligase beta subunit-related protein [Thermoanaerobaculia bacterium]|jgi:DNA/RNA-binding domain of Phe-tRNA-synthetase-like protein|nr:phenylalanine--tRNA ligase beta subunit-related protein [Thermoanaerobaculia bacterium]
MTDEIRIEIDPEILERFPACRVGGFLARGLASAAQRVTLEPAEALAAPLSAQGVTVETISEEPRIREWRKAYQQSGVKPSTYKSSAEQLARRLLKGSWISTPLPLVNLYSAVSVKHLAPMGAYDVARLPVQEVVLRLPREGDVFHPLGAKPEDMPLKPTVPIYASGSEVTCWAFNHRDSTATCLHPETDLGIFMAEAVAEVQLPSLEAALDELARDLRDAGAVVGGVVFATPASPRTVLPGLE